jgi:hypothetical protein
VPDVSKRGLDGEGYLHFGKQQANPRQQARNELDLRWPGLLVGVTKDQHDGRDHEVHDEGSSPPDAKDKPLLVLAVHDQALGLEVHVPELDVNQPQVVVSDATVPRFGQQRVKALDDPLTLKLGLVDDGIPDISTQHCKSQGFDLSEVLHYPQYDSWWQTHPQFLRFAHLSGLLLGQG